MVGRRRGPLLVVPALVAILLLGVLVGCSGHVGGPTTGTVAPTGQVLDDGVVSLVPPSTTSMGYLVRLPGSAARGDRGPFPVLVYLHGTGEVGDGSTPALRRLESVGLPALAAGHLLPPTARRFVVLAPQTSAGRWDPTALRAWLHVVLTRYPVDRTRVYLTGISRGGGGVVEYLDKYGGEHEVAAALVVSQDWTPGDGSGGLAGTAISPLALPRCAGLASTPLWAVVGDLDTTVPHQLSTNLVGYLDRHCRLPERDRVTVLLSTFHNAWDKVYDLRGMAPGSWDPAHDAFDEDPYSWLLAHHR